MRYLPYLLQQLLDSGECDRGQTIIDAVALETPTFKRDTSGWWMDVPRQTLTMMQQKCINAAESIHAASHAILNQFPMQQDISTECKVAKKEYRAEPSKRKRPARCVKHPSQCQHLIASQASCFMTPRGRVGRRQRRRLITVGENL